MRNVDLKTHAQYIIACINEFKWIESERLGYDIGENEAARLWIKDHYKKEKI